MMTAPNAEERGRFLLPKARSAGRGSPRCLVCTDDPRKSAVHRRQFLCRHVTEQHLLALTSMRDDLFHANFAGRRQPDAVLCIARYKTQRHQRSEYILAGIEVE